MNPNQTSWGRASSVILQWNAGYLMNIGMFSAMALTLALPTGAGGGLVLLICSVVYLICSRHQFALPAISRYEFLFLGSMILYPLAIAFNCLVFVESILWRYFDNPSRFLMGLLIYWAIRKSRITPDTLVMGAIIGASISGILAIYQWMIIGYGRPYGFTNPIPFAQITLLLICIALIPISLPGIWSWARICGIGLGVIALFLSQVLGVWITIPILILLMTDWFSSYYKIGRWWTGAAVIISIGLLFLVFQMKFISKAYEEIPWQYMFDLQQNEQHDSVAVYASIVCRIELWRAGLILLSKNPWFGIGFGQYGSEAHELQKEGTMSFIGCRYGGYESLEHAHNDFVQIGSTMGGLMIMTYLLPIAFLYFIGHYCCRQHVYDMGIILKICAVGHGMFSMTQSQLNHNISTTFFVLTAVCLTALTINRIEINGYSHSGSVRPR